MPEASQPPPATAAIGPPPLDAAAAAAASKRSLIAREEHDIEVTDLGISVRHLDRLLGGALLATSPRVDWAKLLRRTHAVDVLSCTRCGGRLRLLSAITEKATARRILEHLGLTADPTVPRARSPDEQLSLDWHGNPAATE